MILVSIYDKKADSYAPCYCVDNRHIALRSFENLIKAGNSDVANFPEDFALMEVGEFINETGEVVPKNATLLSNASDFIKPKDDEVRHSRSSKKKHLKK